MRYFRLFMHVPEDPNLEVWRPGVPQNENGKDFKARTFSRGEYFLSQERVTFEANSLPPDDFTLSAFGDPVVSKQFAEVVELVDPNSVQRIPATVRNRNLMDLEILNIIRLVSCVDLVNSEGIRRYDAQVFPERAGEIRFIYRLRILEGLSEDYHIFRPQEWTTPIIISEYLKQVLEEHEFTGMDIRDLY